ncbi:hypothetical protein [Dechloromonas hortensis]|uniref:hypothetical protein n=1 Tax=Dechloromonas hortensis TaxID=337779 RepID=UPI0012927610|nr:hypothetical protein [Dechloromonas hortensis]
MDLAKQQQFFAQYPRAFRRPIDADTGPLDFWGIETGDGWHTLIAKAATAIETAITQLLAANPEAEATAWPRISQIKEKFGLLRIHVANTTSDLAAALDALSAQSAQICESCGQPGTLNKDGYWHVRCPECAARRDTPACDFARLAQVRIERLTILNARPDFATPALLARLHATKRAEILDLLAEVGPVMARADRASDSPVVRGTEQGVVIEGTDMAVASLFDALIAGRSLADFLVANPDLAPGAAVRVLLRAREMLAKEAS